MNTKNRKKKRQKKHSTKTSGLWAQYKRTIGSTWTLFQNRYKPIDSVKIWCNWKWNSLRIIFSILKAERCWMQDHFDYPFLVLVISIFYFLFSAWNKSKECQLNSEYPQKCFSLIILAYHPSRFYGINNIYTVLFSHWFPVFDFVLFMLDVFVWRKKKYTTKCSYQNSTFNILRVILTFPCSNHRLSRTRASF